MSMALPPSADCTDWVSGVIAMGFSMYLAHTRSKTSRSALVREHGPRDPAGSRRGAYACGCFCGTSSQVQIVSAEVAGGDQAFPVEDLESSIRGTDQAASSHALHGSIDVDQGEATRVSQ